MIKINDFEFGPICENEFHCLQVALSIKGRTK